MSPRKKSRSRKKKKKSSKGKIIGIILLLMIIGFSVWTYPSEYTTEYSISTITQETKTFNFNVKMFHSVVIIDIQYNGTGTLLEISIVDATGVYIKNYTDPIFNGEYSYHIIFKNATSGGWKIIVKATLADVDISITVKTMGGLWPYILL
ncbi:MAG: hypothetical protein ACP6IU_05485 [Candidatus Asgardarchaeia archaeon]